MSMQEYDDGRIWYTQKGKVLTVGLTERGLQEIGNVQSVSLPVDGEDCSQDDVLAEVEGDQATFEMIAPMDGSVVAVNDELNENPDVLQNDPLDEGWIFKLQLASNADDEEESEEESE